MNFNVSFTQKNDSYTSWINASGAATDSMPTLYMKPTDTKTTRFMLDLYGPTTIEATVKSGSANVTVSKVAGNSAYFDITISDVSGDTIIEITAV
jgi:hypothetical protein